MKRLKDYVNSQKFTGLTDMEVILAYFIGNDMEEKAMEIAHDLAKAKISKLKYSQNLVKTWVYSIPSEYLYQTYSLEIASRLHRMELNFIVNGEVTGQRLEWAIKNVPNLVEPEIYFVPCMEWLEKQGIKFKEKGI